MSNNQTITNQSNNQNKQEQKLFSYDSTTIIGNIGTDITLRTNKKERIEFQVAVNKLNKQTQEKTAKWFKVVIFKEDLIDHIKNNSQAYKKGTNIKVKGNIEIETYNNKSTLKIIAYKIAINN